ncbi:MAG: hypothetical protein LC808_02870 [Actinobacteria bacterium]|nr:hypothetical protein [Actinomycetota bacterium]
MAATGAAGGYLGIAKVAREGTNAVMPDVKLSIDYTGDERERVLEALRGFNMPDAAFLEEDEEEGRTEPVLRFEQSTALGYAMQRAGEIVRATAQVASVSEDGIRGSIEDPPA